MLVAVCTRISGEKLKEKNMMLIAVCTRISCSLYWSHLQSALESVVRSVTAILVCTRISCKKCDRSCSLYWNQ